jgi:hypothetical protein
MDVCICAMSFIQFPYFDENLLPPKREFMPSISTVGGKRKKKKRRRRDCCFFASFFSSRRQYKSKALLLKI